MSLLKIFLKELELENEITKKMLQAIPEDKFDWQPHPKSMIIKTLATHIAELPTWITMVLTTNELDFAKTPYNPPTLNNSKELLDYCEKCYLDGKEHLEKADESKLSDNWTMRSGDVIYDVSPKHEVIRMTINQIVHHRAQLGVYLRLLNIPLPESYGPTADSESAS